MPSLAARLDLRTRAAGFTRELAIALSLVLLLGVAATQTVSRPGVTAVTVASEAPAPDRPLLPAEERHARDLEALARPAPGDLTTPAPTAAVVAPAPAPPAEPAPSPAAERWLPEGTGMWLHLWGSSEGGSAEAVVARAKATGLTHLYVQTGSSRKGWIGDEVLSQLMPAVRDTGIAVIAWDFPTLVDPEADARRMARAAFWFQPGSPMVHAVAPDVETAAEGTQLSQERVERYYRELRKALPQRTAVLATVPWPSEKRTGWYPYAETAKWSDAFIPMAYWYNRDPATVTRTSMEWLAQFGLPVMPVGQGYDGRIDAPYLDEDPDMPGSVRAFLETARAHDARSVSLWSWQTTDQPQWAVLAEARDAFGPAEPVVAPAAPPAAPSEQPAAGRPDSAGRPDTPGRPESPGRSSDAPRRGQGSPANEPGQG